MLSAIRHGTTRREPRQGNFHSAPKAIVQPFVATSGSIRVDRHYLDPAMRAKPDP